MEKNYYQLISTIKNYHLAKKGEQFRPGKVYTAPFKGMDEKKEIIKIISDMSGKYSKYEIFTDWIRCSAISINNAINLCHDKVWQDREQAYIDTMKKYTLNEQDKMAEMFILLEGALEDEMTDVLGQVFMESDMGSKSTGQFFSPFSISKLCANLALSEIDKNGIYKINEPSCGSGGMIIATASVLKRKEINYQRKMDVVAQDLDWKGVYMCYLQLSLLGIKAICVQGDVLAEPHIPRRTERSRVLITPAKMGVFS